MTKQEFLLELEDILQREESCQETDVLAEYEEWDSLSKLALIAFFQTSFGINLTMEELKEPQVVSDIIKLAKNNII